jgi:hypothetical protein
MLKITCGWRSDDPPSTEVCAKHTVLGFQVIDRRRLLPLRPTGNQHEQEPQQSRRNSHLSVDFGCLVLLR